MPLEVATPNTLPKKQIIMEANKVETYDKQYIHLWKEAIQAIAKAMGTDHIIYTMDDSFEDITIREPDNFVAFIILSNSL